MPKTSARKAREKEAAATPAAPAAPSGRREAPEGTGKKPDASPPAEQIRIALTMPRPAPAGSVALVGARVITMKGDEVLASADILITANRIAAIGPSGRCSIPADARRLDAARQRRCCLA